MTQPGDGDDAYWRRPPAGADPDAGRPVPPAPPPGPAYSGPPPTMPPPPGWRPPLVAQPVPPRQLPAQDHEDLDEAERSARTVTYGVGMIAGAIMLVLLCLFCSRLLF